MSKVVAIEPAFLRSAFHWWAGAYKIQGIGAGFDRSAGYQDIRWIIPVSNDDAFATGKKLERMKGVLVGISSGAALWAAIELAKRPGK